MQAICETCIEEAVKDLEESGFSRESVKVIGEYPARVAPTTMTQP